MARMDDLDALLGLAALSGGGMTNLPHDRDALHDRLAWSERSIDAQINGPEDEFYMLALEDGTGRVIGTASIFSRIGVRWPFYSYKVARVTHVSRGLDRMFSTNVLHLVNDFDGATEVAGLFLHPDARTGGIGAMLARSRYLFIAQHRARFGDQVVAELRGWMEGQTSPFWEAVAGPFFGGGVLEADLFNAMHGNQFIADLMPRYPIYTSMLPEDARAAIGRPHEKSLPPIACCWARISSTMAIATFSTPGPRSMPAPITSAPSGIAKCLIPMHSFAPQGPEPADRQGPAARFPPVEGRLT
jgi:arginine N-succinyltransferase